MSTRVLSWMAVAVGDPLYRPYFSWMQLEANRDSKTAADWRTYHDFAVKNGHLPPMEYRLQARIAALRAHDALELEDVGLMELRDGNYANAIGCLQQARAEYTKRDDIMRCVLEECAAWRKSGKPKRALDLARIVLSANPDSPASELLRKLQVELAPKSTPSAIPSRSGG